MPKERKQPVSKRDERSSQRSTSADPDRIEEKIERLEREKLKLERALASTYKSEDYKRGEKISQRLRKLEDEIEKLYTAWEEA